MNKDKAYYLTPQGKNKLEKELQELKAKRPKAVEELQRARSLGDLSENAAYQAARHKLTDLDRRIVKIEYTLKNSLVVEKSQNGVVELGSAVELESKSGRVVFTIVGAAEADPKKKQISNESPLGKALLGKKQGDSVVLHTPAGKIDYKILKVF